MRLCPTISLVLAVLTSSCLLLTACVAVSPQPITYKVTPGKEDAAVTYRVSGGDVTVEVRSPSGIGSAQLTQTGGDAPTSMTMNVHLKGLEQFTFQYPGATVTAAVSSHDGSVSESVSAKGSAEQAIGPDSPYWMAIETVAADKSIPLRDGYFAVQAPGDFFAGSYREFSVSWVDFYR